MAFSTTLVTCTANIISFVSLQILRDMPPSASPPRAHDQTSGHNLDDSMGRILCHRQSSVDHPACRARSGTSAAPRPADTYRTGRHIRSLQSFNPCAIGSYTLACNGIISTRARRLVRPTASYRAYIHQVLLLGKKLTPQLFRK